MDGVFSLQRAGTDAVFAYQFPAAVTGSASGADGAGTRRRRPAPSRQQLPAVTKPAPRPAAVDVIALQLPGLALDISADDEADDEAAVLAATALLLS